MFKIEYQVLNIEYQFGSKVLLEFATFFFILSFDILYLILLAFVISFSDDFAKKSQEETKSNLV